MHNYLDTVWLGMDMMVIYNFTSRKAEGMIYMHGLIRVFCDEYIKGGI